MAAYSPSARANTRLALRLALVSACCFVGVIVYYAAR